MGAHDDGVAVLGHRPDELEHGVGRLGVEARRGLVVEQEVGVVQDRAGQGQAGLHARRVAPDLLLERRFDAEAGRGLPEARRRSPAGRRARRRRPGCPSRTGGRRAPAWPTRHRSAGGRPRPRRRGRRRTSGPRPGRGSSAPVIMRMAVVLPAPLGPSRTVIWPSGTDRFRSDRASTSPKRRPTPVEAMTGTAGASATAAGAIGRCHAVRPVSDPLGSRGAARRLTSYRCSCSGVDPGLTRCGYGCVRAGRACAASRGPRCAAHGPGRSRCPSGWPTCSWRSGR